MSVYIELWDGEGFSGPVQTFDKPGSYPKLNIELSEKCSSYKVSAGTWAILYEKANFKGLSMVVGSESEFLEEPNLLSVPKNDHQGTPALNWNNNIGSLRVFNHEPSNIDLILTKFLNQYDEIIEEGHEIEWDDNYYYIKYMMQGCTFKMNYPKLGQRTISSDFMEFSLHFQHVLDLNDEEAVLHFSMNKEGDFVEKATVKYSNGIFQLPDWFISMADFVIDQSANIISKAICKLENKMYPDKAAEEAEEIAGEVIEDTTDLGENIGERDDDGDDEDSNMDYINKLTDKIIQGAAKCLTFCIDHINQVISGMASYVKQKDGGSLYFSSVVSHALLRLSNAYLEVVSETTKDDSSNLRIDSNAIADDLGLSWHNRRGEFVCNSEIYTVDIPDVTFGYNKISLFCSAKINDAENDENHVVLNMATDPFGELVYLHGAMYIHSFQYDSENAPNSGMIIKHDDGYCYQVYRKGSYDNTFQALENPVQNSNGQPVSDLIEAFEICLQNSLQATSENYNHDFGNSIFNMPPAAAKVANAIMQSISV